MQAQRNTQIDYIIVNLLNSQPAKRQIQFQVAQKHRIQHSNQNVNISNLGVINIKQFYSYGPGTTLYFAFMRYLIVSFGIMSIVCLPILLFNGLSNGLQQYDGIFKMFMELSTGNQNSYSIGTIQANKSVFELIRTHKILNTITDILITIVFFLFVLYFQCFSKALILILNQTKPLPSSYTLLINNLQNVPPRHYTEQSLSYHFRRYGDIAKISTVYDYEQLLLEAKYFMSLIKLYRDSPNKQKHEQSYKLLEQKYQSIKLLRPTLKPIHAFITFESVQARNHAYCLHKYNINSHQNQYQHTQIGVQKCDVQPINIIWENFHYKLDWQNCIKIFGVLTLVYSLVFVVLLVIYANYMRIQQTFDLQFQTSEGMKNLNLLKSESYPLQIGQQFQIMFLFSMLTFCINIGLTKFIYKASEYIRYRSVAGKNNFLIFNIFFVYFFNNSILILIGHSICTKDGNQRLDKKWYMDSGRQIIVNFILNCIVCPWLCILFEWIKSKFRQYYALKATNQIEMNQLLLDPEFDFNRFYGITLTTVATSLLFGAGIPLLYFLAIFSILSIYLSSNIIFRYFSRKPPISDHSLSQIFSQLILLGVLIHQIICPLFINSDVYVQKKENYFLDLEFQIEPLFVIISMFFIFILLFFKEIIQKLTNMINKINPSIIVTQTMKFTQAYPPTTSKPINSQKNKVQTLFSYKMEQNHNYSQIFYTLTVLNMFIKKQIQLSDQEIVKINKWISQYQIRDTTQRNVFSQVGQYELRQVDLVETERNMSF